MSDTSKPNASHLGWEVTSSERPFENQRFTVRSDSVRVPKTEKEVTYAYVERAKGLIIIPVTAAGEIVLIHQYRYPVDEWVLETPAGSTSDTGDMPAEEVVRKELKEEIGATAGRIEHIGRFWAVPAYSTEVNEVFLAWETELSETAEPEPTENIRLEVVPAREALARAEDGRVQNAVCALALCYARRHLEAAGLLR